MAERFDTMMNPPVEELLDKTGSKFSLVTLAARRARQINTYYNQLGDALGTVVPPQVTSTARKGLSIAFEEIDADKIEGVGGATGKPVPEALLAEQAAAEDGAFLLGTEPRCRGHLRHLHPRGCGDRRLRLRGLIEPSMSALAGRRIVLGVSGGIAAYKAIDVCRRLVDAGAHVVPVMTAGAKNFVGETTFSALASEPVKTSMWNAADPIPHTKLGQTADLIVVAPATARLISAYANGYSHDLLTNTLIATRAPVVVCPAMHTEMWEHPAVVDNVATLRSRGVHIVEPGEGRLAGGDVGKGRLAEPADIVAAIEAVLAGAAGAVAGSGGGDLVGPVGPRVGGRNT